LIGDPLIDSGVEGLRNTTLKVAVTELDIISLEGGYTTSKLNVALLTELNNPNTACVTATKLLEGSDLNHGAI
jgi:hypothetical protein